jgi:hypothetical protein
MSNVYKNITGRSINPAQMARFAQSNGYNTQGGTSAGLFTSGARKLGLASNAISKSGKAISNSIKHGNNVVIAGKNGPYTKSGHIMSVRGVDSRGNAIVDDPLKRGSRRIPMNKLTKGMTHAWSIGHGNAVGYGELYAPNGDGDWYSTWWDDDVPTDNVSFDPNGGAFGYTLTNGCVYISNINGYLNSVMRKLGMNNFTDLITKYNFSPRRLASEHPETRNGDQIKYPETFSALDKIFGTNLGSTIMSKYLLPYYPVSDGYYTPSALYDLLYSNLDSGNPIAFSSNRGTNAKWKDIIVGPNYNGDNDMHSVLLVGIQRDGDGEHLVVDNPNRMGGSFAADGTSTHFYRVDMDYFKNAVLTSDQNHEDIKRVTIFPKNEVKGKVSNNGSNMGNDANSKTDNPNVTPTNSKKSLTSSFTSKVRPMLAKAEEQGLLQADVYQLPENLTTPVNHTDFSEWMADLTSRLAKFASNLLTSALTGKTDNLLSGSGRSSYGSNPSYTHSGDYSQYSAQNIYDQNTNGNQEYNKVMSKYISDSTNVRDMIAQCYTLQSDELNQIIKDTYGDAYTITQEHYDKIREHKHYAYILECIASSAYFTNLSNKVDNNVVFAWLVFLKVIDFIKNVKCPVDRVTFDKIITSMKQTKTTYLSYYKQLNITKANAKSLNEENIDLNSNIDVAYNRYTKLFPSRNVSAMHTICQNASGKIYDKFDNILEFIANKQAPAYKFGSATNDYDVIDPFAKNTTNNNLPPYGHYDIPGGVGGGNTLSREQKASVLHYLMNIITQNETGYSMDDAMNGDSAVIDKMYYTPYWLRNESNVTIGRHGFYNSNAAEVFNRITKSPSLSDSTKNVAAQLRDGIKRASLKPEYIKQQIESHPDMKPYMMSVEDAMANEFTWDYMRRALQQYESRGMTDPRSIILGAEFAGVAPARTGDFYQSVINPGAPDELDQVRNGMFATIATFSNYGLYAKGWKNRINGMYNTLTTANGYNTHTGKYYPVPQSILSMVPPENLVGFGNGDAGYNMRDNIHMYSDDIYMGDADNPMHVVMDSTPVTSRIDKLIELVDSAVNQKDIQVKAGPSNARSSSIGHGTADTASKPATIINRGETSTGKKDQLVQLHTKLARRTRTGINYSHY